MCQHLSDMSWPERPKADQSALHSSKPGMITPTFVGSVWWMWFLTGRLLTTKLSNLPNVGAGAKVFTPVLTCSILQLGLDVTTLRDHAATWSQSVLFSAEGSLLRASRPTADASLHVCLWSDTRLAEVSDFVCGYVSLNPWWEWGCFFSFCPFAHMARCRVRLDTWAREFRYRGGYPRWNGRSSWWELTQSIAKLRRFSEHVHGDFYPDARWKIWIQASQAHIRTVSPRSSAGWDITCTRGSLWDANDFFVRSTCAAPSMNSVLL